MRSSFIAHDGVNPFYYGAARKSYQVFRNLRLVPTPQGLKPESIWH